MRSVLSGLVAVSMAGFLLGPAGCNNGQGGTSRTAPEARNVEGHTLHCQACYDEAVAIRQEHGKGTQWSRSQVIREHRCPDCETMVTAYTKDGVPMIRCAHCAPEGMACDQCLPPGKGK